MSCLIHVKNMAQLQFLKERLGGMPAPNMLVITGCPEVWYDLSLAGKSEAIWAGDFVVGDDWVKIEDEALSLRDGWYKPIEQSLVYEGINLAELIRLEHTHFFRQAVRARIILERVFNTHAVSDVILVGISETPCRDRHRHNNKNGVFEGVLLAEAYKRGITAKRISFEDTSPEPKSQKVANPSEVGNRIFAFDCWKNENSSKLIAVGSPFHLIILEPFVRAWSNQPGCEGLLLNLGKSIERRNKRAGFWLPEDTRFANLADVSTYNQSVEYVQTQRRLSEALKQWKVSCQQLSDTHILKSPYLNFHWTFIRNSLMRLPLAVQKAFEALRIMDPDVVLTDEMASSSIRVFTEVAKQKGILTVDCPHGYVGDIEEFQPHGDLYLAWGAETIRQLRQRFKIDSAPIVVTGSPVNEKIIKSESHTEKLRLYEKMGLSPNKKTVCVVTRSIFANVWPVNIKEFFTRCDEIASLALNQDIQIVIKVSPRADHAELYNRIFGPYPNIYVCTEHSLDELLPIIDVGIMLFYVGTASLLFMHKGIPTIFVLNRNIVNSTDVAWRVFGDSEPLSELCNKFLYNDEARRQRLMLQKQFAGQHLHIDDGDAAQRAALNIKDALKSSRRPTKRSRQRQDILTTQPSQTERGQIGCLAIFAPHFGAVSETFITRQIDNLAPGRTVVVTKEICEGVSPAVPCLVTPHSRGVTVYYSEVEEQIVRFLSEHKVTHILCEYGYRNQSIVELNRRRLHLPIFVHFHGYDAASKLRDPEMVMYYKWMGKQVAGVIAVSNKMAARLAAIGIPAGKIRVIPYGVEVPPSICAVPEKQPCRFVSVTRMVPKKAPLLLLQAFKKVHEHISDCTLDVIGDGTLFAEAKRFVDANSLGDSVALHGARPNGDVMKYMHASCVYVQHSITDPETGDAEGLPNSILEASLAGLPVVSTLHEGIPDEVEHGITGFLVEEGDVDGMADYMIKLAQDPQMRRTMGIAAHKKVAAEFNLPLWMQRLRDFLTSSDVNNIHAIPANHVTPADIHVIPAEAGIQSTERNRIPSQAHSDRPKVSIIMSCYNCEKFIRESLDSILAQTMSQWELFVLDDASTDGTRNIIAEYSAKDTRIKPFYFDSNEGPYVRRNFAITRANSDFIIIHDGDDIMAQNKVQRLYEEITSDNRLGIVGAFWRNFIDKFKGLECTEKHEFPTEHNDIVMGMITGRAHAISHASGIIRKALFGTVGLYDENRCACDSFWLAKVAEYAYLTGTLKLKNIPEFLMLRRIHSASQTRKVPYCDPRSRRRLYKQYYLYKLEETAKRLRGSSLADIKAGLRNCTCSGFVKKYRREISKLKNQPVAYHIIIELLHGAITSFYRSKYISCITTMDAIETMCNDFVKVFKNCDLLRAMCYFGLDMKQESLRYLNREIRNHHNPAAERFLTDFDRQCATNVGEWYTENSKYYDPRLTISNCLEQSDPGDRSAQLNKLKQELASRSWEGKYELYQKFFDYVDYRQQIVAPTISVVVISWKLHPDTIKSFESLIRQRNENFELVFVGNGAKPGKFECLKPFIDTYVRLNQNTGAYLARNFGAIFATGRVLLFLDDDGIPAPDILRSYREAFDKYVAIAVRGSIWPKDRNAPPYTEHLYYGDRPFPYFSCQEGNTAYRASFFYTAGGWDDEIILGGAGLDLSRRLLDVAPDMRKQIYWPKAVLYHDKNNQRADWQRKKQIRDASVERLQRKHPDYGIFQQCYKKYYQREDLLIHKDRWGLSEPDVKEVSEHLYQNQELFKSFRLTCQDATHSRQVLALNDRGKTLMENGNIREAMRCFTKAFRLDPTDFGTVSNICRLYKSMGWAKEAEVLMQKYSPNNVREPGISKPTELLNVKPRVCRSGDLKFSFIMIVLNGMPFIEYSLKSVYNFAHEIIIAEGAVEDCMFAANPDGSSKDATVEFIKSFPDPANKIKLIQGRWPEKCEMQNEALKYVTGNYVWLIDSDEVYKKEDIEKIKELLRKDPSITQVNFIPDNFWKGLDYIFVSPMFFEHAHHFRRLFKYVPGAQFTTHRPPTMVWPNSSLTTEQMHLVDGLQTRQMGIILYHYSYVVDEQVVQKMEYYGRRGPWEVSGLNRSQWYHQCYLKWTPANRKEIEARYPVWMGDKNSCTEPFKGSHPQVMADFIAKSKSQADSARQIGTAVQQKKNALVSYITAPLRMGPNYHPFKFSNPGIARSMVKVLTRMGYVVDVIDFNCKDFKSDKVYDLFIGHAGVNWEYLSRNVVGDATKIYFSTGTYWKEHNRREAQRFDNFERRHGVRLPFDRWIKVSEEFACHDADGIICLGNKNAVKSYAAFPVCCNLNNGVYSDNRYAPAAKNFASAAKHFLYFGSAGNIHKGLDLLIEAFMQLDAHLWCTGKVEPAFYKVYADKLSRHPNIHFVNPDKMVPLRSPLFYDLMDRCNCVILPSCAEGSPGGVIECMNQGLMPIVSRGSNVDVADFGIMLETDSVEEIVHVVREVMAKPAQWHHQHSIKTRQAVLRDFSEEAFCTNMRVAIESVIRQTPQVRIMREKVASQAQDNPAEYLNKYADDLGALLRGAAHLKSRNRHDEAAQLLQRAVIVDLSCATAICRLGLYYANRAQMTRAEKLVERALELCPGDKQCLAVLRKIRQTPRSVPKHDTVNSYANEFVTNQQIRSSVDADITGSHINALGNVVDG